MRSMLLNRVRGPISKQPTQGGQDAGLTWFAQGWGGSGGAGPPECQRRLGGLVPPSAAAAGWLAPCCCAIINQGGRGWWLPPRVFSLRMNVRHFSPARRNWRGHRGDRRQQKWNRERESKNGDVKFKIILRLSLGWLLGESEKETILNLIRFVCFFLSCNLLTSDPYLLP